MENFQLVKHVSECFIKPKFIADDPKQPYYLAPGDLAMLSIHYIQKGLLFTKPLPIDEEFAVTAFLERLKSSLSLTLVHFYPLAGQFVTQIDEDRHSSLIFIDCDKGPGARFIHATLDMTVADIVSPTDVPPVVQSFFDHYKAVNHDGHTRPLLSIQVTELIDGIFIGCSLNHAVADGTSFWQFWNIWSEIHRQGSPVSNLPIHERWFQGYGPKITLPFTHTDEFISRYESPQLRERIFHFSSEAILRLKAKANVEAGETDIKISSLQALSALVWNCITRARRLTGDQKTTCSIDANIRQRLDPPLPQWSFGNAITLAKATAAADELLGHGLGWAALSLHQAISELTGTTLRDIFEAWMKVPIVFQFGTVLNANSVDFGSSPRFNVYGNDFGIGKPVAVRSGHAFKFPGKVTLYPGPEGGGSMDLEICLTPDAMSALESDDEFMANVTSS